MPQEQIIQRSRLDLYFAECDEVVNAAIDGLGDYAADAADALYRALDEDERSVYRQLIVDEVYSRISVGADEGFALADELYDELTALGCAEHGAYSLEDANGHVRYAAKNLFAGDPDAFVASIVDYVSRNVRASANVAMVGNYRHSGSGGGYGLALVPQGPTCGFCIMLASRGFDYSEEFGPHSHCDCKFVPGIDGVTRIDGYNPDLYYEQYRKCRKSVEYEYTDSEGVNHREPYESYGRLVRERKSAGKKAPSYSRYLAGRVAAEMDTRDREWLYSGKVPQITFLDGEQEKKIKKDIPHEYETAVRLTGHGFKCSFKDDTGSSDLVGGIEISSLINAEGLGAIDRALRHAGNKSDLKVSVIDNSWGRLDDEGSISKIVEKMNKRSVSNVVFIRSDGAIKRIST